jgi:hypothetical protein
MVTLRVWPAVPAAELLKHPAAGRADPVKGGLWPRDQFTMRRLQDGAITDINPAAKPVREVPGSAPQKRIRRSRSRLA